MVYYNEENLVIHSMMKSDIESLAQGFAEQGWNKSQEQFYEYYTQQENGKS